MLNIMEVHETNKMIEQEKLDVRTITMGISLLDCAADSVDEVCENIYNKITTYAKDLVSPRSPWSAQAPARAPRILSRSHTHSTARPRRSAST